MTKNHNGKCDQCKALIDESRGFWAKVARKNGWFTNPFYVQVWLRRNGSIVDSISFRGMTGDIILTNS